jgi:hypothetical protein
MNLLNIHLTIYWSYLKRKDNYFKIILSRFYLIPVISRWGTKASYPINYVTIVHGSSHNALQATHSTWFYNCLVCRWLFFELSFVVRKNTEVGDIYGHSYDWKKDTNEGFRDKYRQLCKTDFFS